MKRKDSGEHRTPEGPPRVPGLLARARARTEHEHRLSLSTDTPHYAAAALGQTPYVALGNGVIVVQRRCGGWSC